MKKTLGAIALSGLFVVSFSAVAADETYLPYTLANPATIKLDDAKKALTANGFQIAGSVSPMRAFRYWSLPTMS